MTPDPATRARKLAAHSHVFGCECRSDYDDERCVKLCVRLQAAIAAALTEPPIATAGAALLDALRVTLAGPWADCIERMDDETVYVHAVACEGGCDYGCWPRQLGFAIGAYAAALTEPRAATLLTDEEWAEINQVYELVKHEGDAACERAMGNLIRALSGRAEAPATPTPDGPGDKRSAIFDPAWWRDVLTARFPDGQGCVVCGDVVLRPACAKHMEFVAGYGKESSDG